MFLPAVLDISMNSHGLQNKLVIIAFNPPCKYRFGCCLLHVVCPRLFWQVTYYFGLNIALSAKPSRQLYRRSRQNITILHNTFFLFFLTTFKGFNDEFKMPGFIFLAILEHSQLDCGIFRSVYLFFFF